MSSSSDSEGPNAQKIMLSPYRFINVNSFKGRDYINIREYYKDREGMMRPTKKGIMLKLDEWRKLAKSVNEIDRILNRKNEKSPSRSNSPEESRKP